MSATMDLLDSVEAIPVRQQELMDRLARAIPVPEKKPRHTVVRERQERWCSNLDERDLRCLMSVLEETLIPHLLASFSPARAAPLGAANAGPS